MTCFWFVVDCSVRLCARLSAIYNNCQLANNLVIDVSIVPSQRIQKCQSLSVSAIYRSLNITTTSYIYLFTLLLFIVLAVSCSTVTVTKCQAALRTLQAFQFFRPTCLCKEPGMDPDCNHFRDFLFDHPCGFVLKKGKWQAYPTTL